MRLNEEMTMTDIEMPANVVIMFNIRMVIGVILLAAIYSNLSSDQWPTNYSQCRRKTLTIVWLFLMMSIDNDIDK